MASVIGCSLGSISDYCTAANGEGNTDPSAGWGTFEYQMMPIQTLKIPESLADKVVY